MITALDGFENYLRSKNLKERTIENYIYYFNKFIYPSFDQESVSKFLSLKANRNSIARSFLVNFGNYLKVNYKALGISRRSWENIAEVELPKLTGRVKQRLVKPIPHEQITLIENQLATEDLKLRLLLTYYGALRLGELLKIGILSFDWERWKKDPSKLGECNVFGKGDKEGKAFFPAWLMKRVSAFIRSKHFRSLDARLFVRSGSIINLKNQGRIWQIRLMEAGIKAGITKKDEKGKPIEGTIVHPHRLRHSYASHLLNDKDLNLKEVQEVLRHSSLQSTQIYTHIDKEQLKKKLAE